jgi:hypothetical protein
MDKEAASALASNDHWFRYWRPWKFVPLGTGEEYVCLPVNRGLKPLGITGWGCVRWRDHAARAIAFRSDPQDFEGVWYDPPGSAPDQPRRRLILYDDTPESLMDYFARFERLMARASRLNR